jgi:hypothetical protein
VLMDVDGLYEGGIGQGLLAADLEQLGDEFG